MPSTPAQMISVIRFSLSELKARNAHHDFEHLCRHLARLRVYSNVLPATGPVGAGGDAGRDFETFKTSSAWPRTAGSTFAERSSGSRKVAFACSLKDRIEAKIRSDVNDILAGGSADEIVYFCEANLPVAKRHTLQRWAESKQEVELQIFDGQAIAELLIERDTFWVAQEYLSIPSELMPSTADDPDWFRQALDRWSAREPIPVSQSDFLEIKWALRHATFDLEARTKLLFWIERMESFLKVGTPRRLQRSALYELAIAAWRGKGEMSSQLERMLDFFSDLEGWLGGADLQDAATLTVLASGGWASGQLAIDPAEVFRWRKRVADCLDQQISDAPGPGRRSVLLRIRGFLCVLPLEPDGPPQTDEGFDHWNRMLDEAELSPLFPIEDFADDLAKFAPNIGTHLRFANLTDRVDRLVAKRAGQAVAAEKMFDRAVVYYEQDNLILAIREIHQVQTKWFSGDRMPRFQRAMLLLSNCYLELYLPYAAKYYALVAALIASDSDSDEVAHSLPKMLFAAANADDSAGNSLSFLQLLLVAVAAHCRLDPDPLLMSEHPELQAHLGQVAALRGLAGRAGPEFQTVVDKALRRWPGPLRDPVVRSSEEPTAFWMQESWDEVWATIEESFLGRPFGDLGSARIIEWRALGILWSVTFRNSYAITPFAEQFVAQLQITHAALSGLDLCVLSTPVHLEVSVRRSARKFKIEKTKAQEGKPGAQFTIGIPGRVKESDPGDSVAETLSVIGAIIRQCSVLPDEDLLIAVKDGMQVAAKRVFVGRPYAKLYREFVPSALFHADQRRSSPRFMVERAFNPQEHPALKWVDGPGPTYSPEVAEDSVRGRYERGSKCVGITVKQLMNAPETRRRLERLRAIGMKDWEILSIIANAAINIRMPIDGDEAPSPEHLKRFRAALETEEQPGMELSPELFTSELIEACRRSFQGAFLSAWGLTLVGAANDSLALETFLIRRYGLRSDDQAHPDIFGWSESAPTANAGDNRTSVTSAL